MGNRHLIVWLDGRSLLSMAYGNFQVSEFTCSVCRSALDVQNEKQTDVNIAVAMMQDAFQDAFDVALLVSADSDLCPLIVAVRALSKDKRIVRASRLGAHPRNWRQSLTPFIQ